MAHTYVIQSVTHLGDAAVVTGTVDGLPVAVQFSFSTLLTFANTTLAQTYLASIMLPVAIPPVAVVVAIYNGTFTQ